MYMAMENRKTLFPGEIDAHLRAGLPCWRYENGAIRRAYHTNGWKGALLLANAIGHLAEAEWQHPDLHLSCDRIEVSLHSDDAGGVTAQDIALAQKIEEVLLRQPDTEMGVTYG